MTIRRQWMTVLGLMLAAFASVELIWLPPALVHVPANLRCSGSACYDFIENAGWVLVAGLTVALLVMVLGVWVVIHLNPWDRAVIARDAEFLALLVGSVGVVAGAAPIMAVLSGPYALVHGCATVLLVIGISRRSRKQVLTATIVGMLGLAGPLYSPYFAAFDVASSAAFAALFLTLIIPVRDDVAQAADALATDTPAEAETPVSTAQVIAPAETTPPPYVPEPGRATPRRQWITVTGLMPIVLLVASLTGYTFPFIRDAYRLYCSGEGESYTCPDNKAYMFGAIYSGGLITAGVLVLSLLLVILSARRLERPMLARDLQIMAVLMACLPLPVGIPFLLYGFGWQYLVMAALHGSAIALLVVGLARRSRTIAIVACSVGVLAVVGPLFNVGFGPIQVATATWFGIALLATVVPWSPKRQAADITAL